MTSILEKEPTVIVEAVRLVLRVLLAAGVAISWDLQTSIVALVTALVTLVSAGLAAYNRRKVYAPATVRALEQGRHAGTS